MVQLRQVGRGTGRGRSGRGPGGRRGRSGPARAGRRRRAGAGGCRGGSRRGRCRRAWSRAVRAPSASASRRRRTAARRGSQRGQLVDEEAVERDRPGDLGGDEEILEQEPAATALAEGDRHDRRHAEAGEPERPAWPRCGPCRGGTTGGGPRASSGTRKCLTKTAPPGSSTRRTTRCGPALTTLDPAVAAPLVEPEPAVGRQQDVPASRAGPTSRPRRDWAHSQSGGWKIGARAAGGGPAGRCVADGRGRVGRSTVLTRRRLRAASGIVPGGRPGPGSGAAGRADRASTPRTAATKSAAQRSTA